jgi:hypothetical protein
MNIQIVKKRLSRVSQGDIFKDIECIEYVVEKNGVIEVSKIVFPLIVVLTQDCDLEQNARYTKRKTKPPSTDDKRLFSLLVAPLYNAEHVYKGDLDLKMATINKGATEGKTLRQNERPRYHYLEFHEDAQLVPQIVDFKHYFSISAAYLNRMRTKHFVCRISELYREDLSQRFAAYLSRIGLPDFRNQQTPAKGPPAHGPQ